MTLAQQISVTQRAHQGGGFPVEDWQRDWWRATSFWKTVDEGDGVKGVYLDEGKLALMWEIYQAAEDLLGERSEDPLAVMRTAVFGQPYDVEANENEFWREATEFFWSQP